MYGEGYDWSQQYSVSSGDFVGSLPVGMQSRGVTDLPYWPQQNTFVYKEVWVHSSARWLWLMADLIGAPGRARVSDSAFAVSATRATTGEIVVRLTGRAAGVRSVELRADNLIVSRPTRPVVRGANGVATVEWRARVAVAGVPWIAVAVPDGDVRRRREVVESPAR